MLSKEEWIKPHYNEDDYDDDDTNLNKNKKTGTSKRKREYDNTVSQFIWITLE